MGSRHALVALIILLTAACGSAAPAGGDLVDVTFMAGFSPQANLPFVGVYVADQLGFFESEGLAVDIRHSTSGGEHLQLLAAGEVDITTQDAAVVLQRRSDPGVPLVSIALIGQRGQQAYVALADNGMSTPADWEGRSVGFKGTPPPDVFAILDAFGLSPADVDLVNVGFDPRVVTEGQVDVYPVFKSNEPNTLAGWGVEVVSWEAADFGVPTLGLTYVATEETVAAEPEMLAGFMRAVLKGIEYASEHPTDAIDIVLQFTGPDADRDHQMFMLETELEDSRSALTDAHGVGWQTVDQWQALADFLTAYDAITGEIDAEAAFTTDFLPSDE